MNAQNPKSEAVHRRTGRSLRVSGLGFPSDFGFRVSGFRRGGFSFAEVMFAVVILGIGFIMVAAIFPVAMEQTQATGEENIAALAARDAADAITSLPSTIPNPAYVDPSTMTASAYASALALNPAIAIKDYPAFPPTVKNYVAGSNTNSVAPPAVVVSFTGNRWKLVQSDSIVISDTRYAYLPFYRRENGAGSAELIVISVAVRNKATYQVSSDAVNPVNVVLASTTVGGLDAASSKPPPNTPATPPTYTTLYPDTVSVNGVEGASVTGPYNALAPFTGRTYVLGRSLGGSLFEINPGDGLALTAGWNGLWGTGYPTRDATGAISCAYSNNTTLQPTVVYATLAATPNNPAGQITLYSDSQSASGPPNAGPGAFVIIADDYPFNYPNASPTVVPPNNPNPVPFGGATLPPPPFVLGSLNGRIFRLGSAANVPTPAGVVYNLDPAYGMRPVATGTSESPDTVPGAALMESAAPIDGGAYGNGKFRVKAYMVGVGQTAPNSGAYSGASQDIGVFASYFPVK